MRRFCCRGELARDIPSLIFGIGFRQFHNLTGKREFNRRQAVAGLAGWRTECSTCSMPCAGEMMCIPQGAGGYWKATATEVSGTSIRRRYGGVAAGAGACAPCGYARPELEPYQRAAECRRRPALARGRYRSGGRWREGRRFQMRGAAR